MKRMVLAGAGVASALVVAAAGTAGVQALITGAEIKDGTIQSRDIGNGAINRRYGRGRAGGVGLAGPSGSRQIKRDHGQRSRKCRSCVSSAPIQWK